MSSGWSREFGYYHNAGVPVFMTGVQGKRQMAGMLDRLRATPLREVDGLKVTRFEDRRDEERYGPIKGATDAASRNVLVFHFGDQARIALRPSGTEPKAKIYLEACSPPCPAGTPAEAWRDDVSGRGRTGEAAGRRFRAADAGADRDGLVGGGDEMTTEE